MAQDSNNLIWIDLEMTGLEPESHHILEIATIVTDESLDIIAEGPELVVHQPEEVLATMNPWCVEHHGASGLTHAVKASKLSPAEAEEQTLTFLREHTEEGTSPLCGNSVWKDRLFLMRRMPSLDAFLHYRIIDVTSIKVEPVPRSRSRLIWSHARVPPTCPYYQFLLRFRRAIHHLKRARKTHCRQLPSLL